MLLDIAKALESIPALPQDIQKFYNLADDLMMNAKKAADLLMTDQALSAQILKIANSSFYGYSHHVSTVSQAIVIIGFEGVRNLAMSMVIHNKLFAKRKNVNLKVREKLWEHSLAVACASRLIVQKLGKQDPEQGFLMGLLHDLGKVVILEVAEEEYAEILENIDDSDVPLHELEAQKYQTNHAHLGSELCKNWQLPFIFSRACNLHHISSVSSGIEDVEDGFIRTVQLADTLAKLTFNYQCSSPIIELPTLVSFAQEGITQAKILDLALELPVNIEQAKPLFAVNDNLDKTQFAVAPVKVGIKSKRKTLQTALNIIAMQLGYECIPEFDRLEEVELNYILTDEPEYLANSHEAQELGVKVINLTEMLSETKALDDKRLNVKKVALAFQKQLI